MDLIQREPIRMDKSIPSTAISQLVGANRTQAMIASWETLVVTYSMAKQAMI
jgi:hypothetical protein